MVIANLNDIFIIRLLREKRRVREAKKANAPVERGGNARSYPWNSSVRKRISGRTTGSLVSLERY